MNQSSLPMRPETNWSISSGSLTSAVTFESFDSPPIDSALPKPPLLLIPPHDFPPCQITLNFTQKHEIRQVYVRSTARVYEIYYAPVLQSDNEYLCTVRCSAAASEEENLSPETDVKTATSVNSDDWVEVKKLPVSRVDENGYSPNQTSNSIRKYQDYYEATAEINDSEPCMSLTIRLLSLQTKGCVYVDEVYVFADPIDTNDSENQTVNAESSPSSLMTMLVPTLLGLSKSRSAQLHNQNSSNPVGKPSQIELESASSVNPVNLDDQQDDKLLKQCEPIAKLTRSQLPVSTPDKDQVCDSTMKNDFSSNRAELLLEQLVSRVSRIEDICLRFEENMLKPINMETRLERVEQQVELLAKNSQRPVSPSCPTCELNPRNDSQLRGEPELEKAGSSSIGTHKPPEDTSAVESPFCDKKEVENDVIESPKKEQPRKTVSIDDALVAALAGFASFTKPDDTLMVVPLESPEEQSLKSNQVLIDTPLVLNSDSEASVSGEPLNETAPEFTEEENDETTTTCDVYREIPDDLFCLEGMPEVADEETMGPIASFISHKDCETDGQLVKQDSIKAPQILPFDKADILKYFSDQSPGDFESTVDFESPILEVKFNSLENGSHGSHLEAFFSYTDDVATVDDVLITPQWDEEITSANNLLVDLNGDVVEEGVQLDHPHVPQETSFASLI